MEENRRRDCTGTIKAEDSAAEEERNISDDHLAFHYTLVIDEFRRVQFSNERPFHLSQQLNE